MSSEPKPKKLDVFGKIKQQKKQITYTWNIDDFWKLRKECLPGNAIYSPIFNTDVKSRWQIELFPQGNVDDAKEYISIFLFNRSEVPIKAQITYSIIVDDAQAIDTMKIVEKREFECNRNAWGYSKFLSFNYISKLLSNNNTLIIKCKIDLDNTSCIESHENERQVQIGRAHV